MGLERLVMICQEKPSVYETDLFESIMREIPSRNERTKRIIADHIKGSVFLISEGVFPSNVERGYVLRRILRRSIRYGKLLAQPSITLKAGFLIPLAQKVIEIYKDIYSEVKSRETDILTVIQNEEEKFEKTIEKGIKETEWIVTQKNFGGEAAYNWYSTSGVPIDIIKEIAQEKGVKLDKVFELDFEEAIKKHQEISRVGAEKKFGGIGKEATYEATKLHTATHLLHAALREILGNHVRQMGSDITPQRLRFDFSHPQKMTEAEIRRVEEIVNQKIKEDLEVKKEEMPYQKALKSGALALVKEDKSSFPPSFPLRGNSVFKEKYPEMVTVYSVGNFSKEICAGPHVKRTSELGLFKIIKEESSGAGIRRIRAILASNTSST